MVSIGFGELWIRLHVQVIQPDNKMYCSSVHKRQNCVVDKTPLGRDWWGAVDL